MNRILPIAILTAVLAITTAASSCAASAPAEITDSAAHSSLIPYPADRNTYPIVTETAPNVIETSKSVIELAETVNEIPAFENDSADILFSENEMSMLAKTVWGEAGICHPDEQRLVVWTVLQRLGDNRFPDTLEGVITQRDQFCGYKRNNPVEDEIIALCKNEIALWEDGADPPTLEPYAPEAPYYFFDGDDKGLHNWFRAEW